MADQLGLFEASLDCPEGFRYADDIVTPDMERQPLGEIEQLPFSGSGRSTHSAIP